jgi:hypothetical protein
MGLFDIFRKNAKILITQQSSLGSFNVLDETTWIYASDNAFVWKDNTFRDETNENKYVSEKDIVILLSWTMRQIDTVLSLPTTRRYGRQTIIAEFLDGLVAGIPNEVILGKLVQKIPYGHRFFSILDLESWDFASTKSLIWKNDTLYNINGEPITEIDMVQLFRAIFAFLEKKEPLTNEQIIKSINTLLDRMAKCQSDPNGMEKAKDEFMEEFIENTIEEASKFDPRKQETYQYATERQLTIDDKQVWYPIYENGKKIKEPVSEETFVTLMKILWKSQWLHQKTFDMAMSEMKNEIEPELKEKIEKSGITIRFDCIPKYKDKFSEMYEKMKKQLSSEVPEIIDKDFIEDRIYQYLRDMDHRRSIIRKTK